MLILDERVQIILWQAKFDSVRMVQRQWKLVMKSTPPSANAIRNLFNKFIKTGSVLDKPRSGRTPCENQKISSIRTLCEEHPKTSLREASSQLNIPNSTIREALKYKIGMRVFHYSPVHQLLEDDYIARVSFCKEMKKLLVDKRDYLKNIFYSDESIFKLDGQVNWHNSVIWGYENPHLLTEKGMRSPGVIVWAGIFQNKIIGPYFFEGTVTDSSYLKMLTEYLIPTLKASKRYWKTIFQQDGASPNWALPVRNFLNDNFPQRWIGRNGPVLWPARSPDKTPMDYFLWGYVKEKVYKHNPQNITQLKQLIKEEIEAIPHPTLAIVFDNFVKRLDLCLKTDGQHF